MPVSGIDRDAGERLGALDRELLDLHAALDAAQRQVRAVRAIQQHREVVLLVDAGALGDHDALDDVALDVEAEDRLRRLVRLVGGLGDLHAARLAAAAGLDLRLDDDHAADLLGCGPRLFRRVGDEAGEHRHLVLLEEVACLVLVQIHSAVLRWGDRGYDAEKRLDVEITRPISQPTTGGRGSRPRQCGQISQSRSFDPGACDPAGLGFCRHE